MTDRSGNGKFVRDDDGVSRPRELAAVALQQLKQACLNAGLTEEELESDEQQVREEIATNGRYTPPSLKMIHAEEST